MIELKNITKRYGGTIAVDQVSFQAKSGELLVTLGPSGCGKTTLLRLIAGFEEPDSGEIIIDGQEVSSTKRVLPPNKRRIGMVFQDLALWPHMTVRENIEFGLRAKRMNTRERRKRIDEVINLVGLGRHIDSYPSQLSGGEQQRVAVARTIVLEPKILLMDEPLANLDLQLRDELQRMVVNLQQRLKITLLYVTHDQNEALSLADRVVVMNNGRIEQIGSPEDLSHRPATEFVAGFIRFTSLETLR